MEKISLDKKIGNRGKGTLIFLFLCLAFSAVFLYLYFRQSIAGIYSLTVYESDMYPYILEMQGRDSGCIFSYPLLFKLAALFNIFLDPAKAMTLAVLVLQTLSLVIMYYYIRRKLASEDDSLLREAGLALLTVSLFFVSMLFDPFKIVYVFVGPGSPNPHHNATYVAARPFAIVAFFSFCSLLEKENGENTLKDALLFAASLFLCTAAKPSYPLIFLSAGGAYEFYRLVKNKFKNIKEAVTLLVCVLPTLVYMVYQKSVVFDETGGIGFCLGRVWRYYQDCTPLTVLKGVAFPIAVLCFNYRKLSQSLVYRFAWLQFAASFCEAYFLYEKGYHMEHFNFSWGYYYGMFFLFVASVIVLVRSDNKKSAKIVQWAVYGAHLLCGILYFAKIFVGGDYS